MILKAQSRQSYDFLSDYHVRIVVDVLNKEPYETKRNELKWAKLKGSYFDSIEVGMHIRQCNLLSNIKTRMIYNCDHFQLEKKFEISLAPAE